MKKLLLLALVLCSAYTFADVITIDGKAYDVEIKKVKKSKVIFECLWMIEYEMKIQKISNS